MLSAFLRPTRLLVMGQNASNDSNERARLAMRKRAKLEDAAGFRRVTIALSPEAIRLLEEFMAASGYTSRQAAINNMFERIADDMFMRQEFLAVST